MPHKNPSLHRITYDCMKNGVEFRVVTFGGVITEATEKNCIGHDLAWLKRQLKKGEIYHAKEVEKPIPMWLTNKDFEGNWDSESNFIGKVIEEELKIEITNPTVLPKGIKFI